MANPETPHDLKDPYKTQPTKESGSAADTTDAARQAPAGDEKQGNEPSGYTGISSGTAGPGPTGVQSSTPENKEGHINPSPESSNVTPGNVPEEIS